MSDYDSLHWTDERWEQYHKLKVTIPVSLLDRLCIGAELLARGARIEKENRPAWEKLAGEGYGLSASVKREITQTE